MSMFSNVNGISDEFDEREFTPGEILQISDSELLGNTHSLGLI